MARIVTYECKQCGSKVVVTEALESHLSPIYCCGIEVTEVSSAEKKSVKPKKRAVKKVTKKKVAKKKKLAAKKKSSKKSR